MKILWTSKFSSQISQNYKYVDRVFFISFDVLHFPPRHPFYSLQFPSRRLLFSEMKGVNVFLKMYFLKSLNICQFYYLLPIGILISSHTCLERIVLHAYLLVVNDVMCVQFHCFQDPLVTICLF